MQVEKKFEEVKKVKKAVKVGKSQQNSMLEVSRV
jgi:hypothetical protein